MQFPEGVFYTESHEWVRVEGDVAIVVSQTMPKTSSKTSSTSTFLRSDSKSRRATRLDLWSP